MTPEQRARALELEFELAGYGKTQNHKATKPQKQKESGFEDFAEGVVSSGMGTYYGVKDLFGKMDDEDRATLEDWRQDASESGWGTAGQVVGEIGQLAIPAGAVLKGARLANMGKNALRATSMGGDIAASTALGGIQAPVEGSTRAENATEAALGATAGGVLGGVLGKAMRGIRKTPEAQAMLDEGIDLTPAQASAGGIPQSLEAYMQWAPFTAKGTNEARETALAQWNNKVLNEVSPENIKIAGSGSEGFRELDDAISKAYDDAWSKADAPSSLDFNRIRRGIVESAADMDSESQRVLKGAWETIGNLRSNFTPERLRAADRTLREDIQSTVRSNNRPLRDRLKQIRQNLRDATGETVKEDLRKVDSKYDQFLTVIKATANDDSLSRGGVFSPQALQKAGKRIGGDTKAARAEQPLVDIANTGVETVGRQTVKPLIDVRKALSQYAPSPSGVMHNTGKAILGETGLQKNFQQSEIIRILRELGLSGATLGGALGAEE